MVMKGCSVFLFLLVSMTFMSHPLMSQSLADDVRHLLESHAAKPQFSVKNEAPPEPLDMENTSEIKMLFMVILRGYQLFISSQDMPVCNFKPSCSRFSQDAFKQTGFVQGLLLTSDRLQRCNGMPDMPLHYELLPKLRRFSDPVENYLHVHSKRKKNN